MIRRFRIKKIITIIMLVSLSFGLCCGCKDRGYRVCESFLKEFFSINNNSRHTDFREAISTISKDYKEDSEAGVINIDEDAVNDYYASLLKYTTDEGIEKIINSGDLLSIDAACLEVAQKWDIVDISIENLPKDSGSYNYTVKIKSEKKEIIFSGNITIKDIDGEVLVSNLIIDDFSL